jgi:hypothetical protein
LVILLRLVPFGQRFNFGEPGLTGDADLVGDPRLFFGSQFPVLLLRLVPFWQRFDFWEPGLTGDARLVGDLGLFFGSQFRVLLLNVVPFGQRPLFPVAAGLPEGPCVGLTGRRLQSSLDG